MLLGYGIYEEFSIGDYVHFNTGSYISSNGLESLKKEPIGYD